MSAPLLELIDLVKIYQLARERLFGARAHLRAVDGVDLTVTAGRSYGIVGESGSGKSTLARCAVALERPTSGQARLMGRSLIEASRRELRGMRAHMQMIFQDPYGSLDPRQRVGRIIAEPLSCLGAISSAEMTARVEESLQAVGLVAADARKYPHQFSGGQRQRVAIARALITRPKLVVADEPVSALDVSVQAQVLNLMMDLQQRAGVTYLLISHDLAVVEHVCDEIAVIFHGRFVETGLTETLLGAPAHPYTRALIEAAPKLKAGRGPVSAPVASASVGVGCAYASRCPYAQKRCRSEVPVLRELADGRRAACHFPLESKGLASTRAKL
jgi:peptide/nickel transport system ATP-binding protein